jgi:hypothetical protein
MVVDRDRAIEPSFKSEVAIIPHRPMPDIHWPVMRRGDDQDHRPGTLGYGDASRGILDHEAPARARPELLDREHEAVGCQLPMLHVLGGNQPRRNRQSGGLDPTQRQRLGCGGHDAPLVARQPGEERGGGGDRLDPFHVLDFGLGDRGGFGLRIDTGKAKPPDCLDRLNTMDRRQECGDIDALAFRPGAPDALGRLDRIQDRSVHIEQHGIDRSGLRRHPHLVPHLSRPQPEPRGDPIVTAAIWIVGK